VVNQIGPNNKIVPTVSIGLLYSGGRHEVKQRGGKNGAEITEGGAMSKISSELFILERRELLSRGLNSTRKGRVH